MRKQTVEHCPRLDARFWAKTPLEETAETLAFRLANALQRLETSDPPEKLCVVLMQWTRGRPKEVVARISWVVAEAEGNQVFRLLLLPHRVDSPQRTCRRQEVRLDWHTKGGKSTSVPVLLCPFCVRRCRYLYLTPVRQEGGPRVGEFACRICAHLCFARQLRYRCAWLKTWDTLQRLFIKADRHPERLTDQDVARAEAAAAAFDRLGQRYMDRLFAPLDLLQAASEAALGNDTASANERGAVEGVNLPKKRGRPSLKRQRQEARLLARLQREAERQATPRRPAGRPKTRRAYSRSGRKESGCSGRLAPNESYCVGCRAGRQLVNASPFIASNGRPGIKGKCAGCGRGLCRMGC